MMNKYLISLVGATGIGKTALSIQLAKHFNAPIISCDSRQFYREMTIGTAVPTEKELSQAKHYFIQNRSIHEDYSVGDFEKDAIATLEELFDSASVVIMVGGSGLYTNAVLNGLDDFPYVAPEIREELNALHQSSGLQALQRKLKELDPDSYAEIEIDNPHRVIRALEICIGTGKPYSSFKNKPKKERSFIPIKIGITAPREIMYDRINQRVELMLKNGLLDEANKLFKYKHLNALQTVGYKELFSYFEGKYTLDFAIEEIKKNTRRFAKRQVTWNKKDREIIWFDFLENQQNIIEVISERVR